MKPKIHLDRLLIHGFPGCSGATQKEVALDRGYEEKIIWVEGRGPLTLENMRLWKGMVIGVVGGLRVLGPSAEIIRARMRRIEKAGAAVHDLMSGLISNSAGATMMSDAVQRIRAEKSLTPKVKRDPRNFGYELSKLRTKKPNMRRMHDLWFDQRIPTGECSEWSGLSPSWFHKHFGPSGRPRGHFVPGRDNKRKR